MTKTLNFPPGTAINFTSGEYSDYSSEGVVVTLKQCDIPALAEQYRNSLSEEERLWGVSQSAFVSWLVASGWAFPADVTEVHLGSYGDWSEEIGGSR